MKYYIKRNFFAATFLILLVFLYEICFDQCNELEDDVVGSEKARRRKSKDEEGQCCLAGSMVVHSHGRLFG